jgi:2-C-methyl-D-erythritol 4-phosphate cytidylyltransferase
VNNNSVWAVVPAAGIGSRMQADRPKQYLPLGNKTVIEQTIERLATHSAITGVVVALAPEDTWWTEIKWPENTSLHLVDGGQTRADSVHNALHKLAELTSDNPWVLVHDAARPCIRHDDIDAMILLLSDHSVGGVLGVPVNDTVKRVCENKNITSTVDREGLWRASTPQMFRLDSLSSALIQAKQQGEVITDEASAMEFAGFQPKMIEGHADNIKITLPSDLALAELFLQQQAGEIK